MKVVSKSKYADTISSVVDRVNRKYDYELYNSVIIAQSVLETRLGTK